VRRRYKCLRAPAHIVLPRMVLQTADDALCFAQIDLTAVGPNVGTRGIKRPAGTEDVTPRGELGNMRDRNCEHRDPRRVVLEEADAGDRAIRAVHDRRRGSAGWIVL